MSEPILEISQSGSTRRFVAEQLPIALGGRADSDVLLEDARGEVQVGMLDGNWFVQSVRGAGDAQLNAVALRGTQKLGNGDVIQLDGARMQCTLDGDVLAIRATRIAEAGAQSVTQDAARDDDAIAISPIDFRAQPAAVEAGKKRISTGRIVVGVLFAVLAIIGWFAFTAKSVQFVFDGVAQEVALNDTWLRLKLGDRYLLRSGEHRVQAQREGYYPLDVELDVGAGANQRIELPFELLPGLVTIDAVPADDTRVYLGNRLIGSPPFEDFEIEAGEYTLRFERERHFPVDVPLSVRGGHVRQRVSVELDPNWAPVSVASAPAGAEVIVDGQLLGTTPATLELEAGERVLELRLAGYNAYSEQLEVTAAQPLTLEQITLQQADGRVRLVSEPAQVAISLNGEYAGTTPVNLRLRPGRTHTVVASKPGHAAQSLELTVAADSGRTISLELEALFGNVSVVSEPPGAQVRVDGEVRGTTPTDFELSALPHEIEVELDGYAARTESLTPRPGFTHALEYRLEPLDDVTGAGYTRRIMTSQGQPLVVMPSGEFTMGSSRREEGRRSNEVLHVVKLTRAFYLGTTEVTNAQFREFRPDHNSGDLLGNSLNEDDQPVVNVTWVDIAEYLNWLSIKDGLQPVYEEGPQGWAAVVPLRNGYRLPTEAEWAWAARFAARAEPLTFPWSADITQVTPPDRSGNYADVSAADTLPTTLVTYNDSFIVSAPVASFEPDSAGIYDLGGNVAEWVHDYYSLDFAASSAVAEDPLGPESGTWHVVRGSSWRSASLTDLRLAARDYSNGGRDDLGFRIARNIE